jgi:hypothetical protein
MQAGFLSALFDRMETEGWVIASDFPKDRLVAAELRTKPELFWREVLNHTGAEAVAAALQGANTGVANANHHGVSQLLWSGRCGFALTTNFDEHVESALPESIRVEVPSSGGIQSPAAGGTLIKLHGTVSQAGSLSFTLEHYDGLKARNAEVIERLTGSPLIIVGYSGNDTDVLPALAELAPRFPQILIVRHPGTTSDQPIFGLASDSSNVSVVELSCAELFNELGAGFVVETGPESESLSVGDRARCYSRAAGSVSIWQCPHLMMVAFQLEGNWAMVRKYAWLTHDSCFDSDETGAISPEEFRRIHLGLAQALKSAGDDRGCEVMIQQARASIDRSGGSTAEAVEIIRVEAFLRQAPHQTTGKRSPSPPDRGLFHDRLPSKVMEEIDRLGISKSPHDLLAKHWQAGMAKQREGDQAGAIMEFEKALPMLRNSGASHLETGRFLLDYGNSLFMGSVDQVDPAMREEANRVYSLCISITERSGDWPTNSRAHLMMAKLFFTAEQHQRALVSLDSALASAAKSHDAALTTRILEFQKYLNAGGG